MRPHEGKLWDAMMRVCEEATRARDVHPALADALCAWGSACETYDEAEALMGCGHHAYELVSSDEGTQQCGACVREGR